MLKGFRFQALAFVAMGAGLGYLAANGALGISEWARADSAAQSTPSASSTTGLANTNTVPTCCLNGRNEELLLAQADFEIAQAGAQKRPAPAQGKKPNVVIIWGDDVGQSDISAYSMGLMGFKTPNIDRVAKEGMIFTDYYAEQSCTAGRASFVTGQHGLRNGLTKVGLPAATLGLQKDDPTIAELLKPLGYATGQFGKNHLGDRNEFLPTAHGFDEFYGNLTGVRLTNREFV